MTRVNTEAALVCLTSMVEDLVRNKSGPMDIPKWLGEISPAVIKLKSFIEIVCQKANYFMSFLDLMVGTYCVFIYTRAFFTSMEGVILLICGTLILKNKKLGNKNLRKFRNYKKTAFLLVTAICNLGSFYLGGVTHGCTKYMYTYH